ncbi:MAG: hypothetical protein QF357_01920 [Dehalococcoidia bacterium]|jgi:hypothetical protein|nr:hypothetical protein [Dehalococcoidia bacterium]
MTEERSRVRRRRNVVSGRRPSFRKRYEAVGYWALLAIVLMLVIWFLASSAADSSDARDAEATAVATLFVAESATAAAEELTETPE